jgi:hypothetical protein
MAERGYEDPRLFSSIENGIAFIAKGLCTVKDYVHFAFRQHTLLKNRGRGSGLSSQLFH